MYVYVIEMLVNDEIVTSYIFLTHVTAYRKFIDLMGKYYDSVSVRNVWFIEREINDETGVYHDRLIDKMDSLVSKEEDTEEE